MKTRWFVEQVNYVMANIEPSCLSSSSFVTQYNVFLPAPFALCTHISHALARKWFACREIRGRGSAIGTGHPALVQGIQVSISPHSNGQNASHANASSLTYTSPSAPLLTLNPKHMSRLGQETFDVSHLYRVIIPIFPEYGVGYTSQIRFPPGTKGVFYYHQSPALPPTAGEMRFRICDEVSQFAKGKDLEIEIGEPWSIPLYKIVKFPYYNKVQDLILREGFVDPGLIADIEKMAGEGMEPKKKGIAIYDIEQPFVVNLSATSLRLRLNTRTCVRIVRFRPFTIFRAMNGPQFRPFGGAYLLW